MNTAVMRRKAKRHLTKELKGKFRILLVEDNRINQKLAINVLSKKGHMVELAENGQIALDKLKDDNDFDAVLMDIQMPVMDGLEATRKIRERRNDIPIIAMTANAFDTDRENCFNAGMNDFIAKPIDVKLLFEKLNRWVQTGI